MCEKDTQVFSNRHGYNLLLLLLYCVVLYLSGFVSCIDQLFDEELLIGTGWTTRETVRYEIGLISCHNLEHHNSTLKC